jgi:transcriptional regulator with XRE-family HTH domain
LSEINIHNIGLAIKSKRGGDGIRDVAAQIGISPATLSRVENGKLPDLETFPKICRWLGVDGGSVLGCGQKKSSSSNTAVTFHLKADRNLNAKTAGALANLILTAQKMVDV